MFDLLLNLKIFNFLVKISFIILILILSVILLLFFFQNKLIYVPSFGQMIPQKMSDNPIGYRSPSERGLQFKDVEIETSDGETLHGWFIYNNNDFKTFRKKKNSASEGSFCILKNSYF